MNEPIEEIYFKWLYSTVASEDFPTPSLTYWNLLRELHNTEFVWLLPGDDNRAKDGLDIRKEFLRESFLEQDAFWMNIGCSILEMLIAFSRRAEFETDLEARNWFWIFIDNLGLLDFNDAYDFESQDVSEVLYKFVWRTYDFDGGNGGLLPLHNAIRDQRTIEIWYQLAEYLVDQDQL